MGDDADFITPEDSPEYVARRLMQIEAAIYRGPSVLSEYRRDLANAEEAHDMAKAEAVAAIRSEGAKLTAPEREAEVFRRTTKQRKAHAVAEGRYEYAKDVNRALDREKDALQTRSANMRAQMTLAGRGQA